MLLGILPSRPVPIKPSLTNEVNILGTPTCARSSLFVTRSCQLMLKILLRQCREGVESAFLVAGVEGPGLSTVGQLAEHAGLVYFNMVVLLLCQYVCVVQCLGRSEAIWTWKCNKCKLHAYPLLNDNFWHLSCKVHVLSCLVMYSVHRVRRLFNFRVCNRVLVC